MDAIALLLTTAFRHVINEPNIETGYERFAALTNASVDAPTFHHAVATCLREGLIREPVRLPEGALQCHWHLELTAKGVEVARTLVHLSRPAGDVAEHRDAGAGLAQAPRPHPVLRTNLSRQAGEGYLQPHGGG